MTTFTQKPTVDRIIPICHHCGVQGHTRPQCRKLHTGHTLSAHFAHSDEYSKFIPICHFFGVKGRHTRPNCFKLYGYPILESRPHHVNNYGVEPKDLDVGSLLIKIIRMWIQNVCLKLLEMLRRSKLDLFGWGYQTWDLVLIYLPTLSMTVYHPEELTLPFKAWSRTHSLSWFTFAYLLLRHMVCVVFVLFCFFIDLAVCMLLTDCLERRC